MPIHCCIHCSLQPNYPDSAPKTSLPSSSASFLVPFSYTKKRSKPNRVAMSAYTDAKGFNTSARPAGASTALHILASVGGPSMICVCHV
jgi:hypothetical protein